MPLSDSQRDHLERLLLAERERVTAALDRLGQRFAQTEQNADGDLSNVPLHFADLGTDESARQVDAQDETRIDRGLHEIDAALERLYREPASFGQDERTGEDIPFERLQVIPCARRRVDERHTP